MTQPLIVIARVHGGNVDPKFFQSYEALVQTTAAKGVPAIPAVVERLHVDRARNEIVDMVLHPERPRPPQYPEGVNPAYKQATHVFFIDDDMLLPPTALLHLLKHDVPIVGGLYFGRMQPHLPIAYRHVEDNQWIPITEFCAGLQEVDAIGAGCLLIKREVFEKMSRPWFEFSDRMGEDMYFCEQAKQLGYTILLDADVECKHIAQMEVDRQMFEAYKSQGLNFQSHPTQDIGALSREVRPYRPNRAHLRALVHAS